MLNRMFLHHSSMYNMRCMYSLDNYLLIVVVEDVKPLRVTKISPSFSSFFPNGRLRGLGAYLAVGNHVLFTERKTYSLGLEPSFRAGTTTQTGACTYPYTNKEEYRETPVMNTSLWNRRL